VEPRDQLISRCERLPSVVHTVAYSNVEPGLVRHLIASSRHDSDRSWRLARRLRESHDDEGYDC
jgi:hypothetical protein